MKKISLLLMGGFLFAVGCAAPRPPHKPPKPPRPPHAVVQPTVSSPLYSVAGEDVKSY